MGTSGYSATFTNIYKRHLADLTITKSGAQGIDANQSFIFTVFDSDGNKVTDAVIHGNNSVTIKDLPIGNYTVTEKDSWSWRYNPDAVSKNVPLTANNTVSFANSRNLIYWLDGNAWCDNVFYKGFAKTDGAGEVENTKFNLEAVLRESEEVEEQTETE